jgi:membrane protease subunit HflC
MLNAMQFLQKLTERMRSFFEFYRSINAYGKALDGGNSTMVVRPDSEFFNYLKSDNGS